jgi:hypothetical protein
LKAKLCLLAALFVVLSLVLIVQVKAADFSWKDDFNYANLQEMEDAGWTYVNSNGISFQSGGVVIDGTKADTIIRYRGFPSGIYEWSVETKSTWLGTGHSGPGINVITEKHSYGVVADGWYNHFAFARDGNQVTFGSYKEQANVWVTMTITKKGDAVNVYCNGVLIYNYTEVDTASYKLTGVDRIAPWRGVMLYDYYQVAGPGVVAAPTAESGGFPIFYVAVGGGIAAIVAIGAVVYFIFFAGGSAAAVAGVAGGTAAGALSGTASASLVGSDEALYSLASNLMSETVSDILKDLGYDAPGSVEVLRGDSASVAEAVDELSSKTLSQVLYEDGYSETECGPDEPPVSPKPSSAPANEDGDNMEFDSGAQAEDGGGTDQSSKEQSSVYDDPEAASPDVEWSSTTEE